LEANKKISLKELEKNYTFLEGNFNLEGTWQCDLVPEFSGALFMQVIFVKMEAEMKDEFEIISMNFIFKETRFLNCLEKNWSFAKLKISRKDFFLIYSMFFSFFEILK